MRNNTYDKWTSNIKSQQTGWINYKTWWWWWWWCWMFCCAGNTVPNAHASPAVDDSILNGADEPEVGGYADVMAKCRAGSSAAWTCTFIRHTAGRLVSDIYTGWTLKMSQHENDDISEILEYFRTKFCSFVYKITVQNFAALCCSTWHTPNWRKRKL